jgi:hypothetical protein
MSATDRLVATAAPGNEPRVSVYRVIDVTELAYLRMTGNYGSNPSRSGKYFALTLAGARAFTAASINAGSRITETSLPRTVVDQGWPIVDPGPHGAGASVYFDESQLPMVYADMGAVVVVP